jgi:hypothetical protein
MTLARRRKNAVRRRRGETLAQQMNAAKIERAEGEGQSDA